MRNILHIFLILAFVLSGISPACAFISGKSSLEIEICTAEGLKKVSLPGDQPAEEHEHKKKDDCGFCFAQSHLKSAKADAPSFSFAQSVFQTQTLYSASAQIERAELSVLSPRAPP